MRTRNMSNKSSTADRYNKVVDRIRATETPYTDGRKYLPKNQQLREDYFTDLVNEALYLIHRGKKGYIYHRHHIQEIVKIIPNCNIKYDEDDGCWYCWIGKDE